MEKEHQSDKGFWVGMIILLVLAGTLLWSYKQFSINYLNILKAHRMDQSLIWRQNAVIQEYKSRITLFQRDLAQTEALLKQVEVENNRLHQKIILLGQVAELEKSISGLKEENTRLVQMLNTQQRILSHRKSSDKEIDTLAEAHKRIALYRKKIRHIARRIHQLRVLARRERVARQEKEDQALMLLGNNGFMIRNGRPQPMEIPRPASGQQIRVDVQFIQ